MRMVLCSLGRVERGLLESLDCAPLTYDEGPPGYPVLGRGVSGTVVEAELDDATVAVKLVVVRDTA